MMTKTENAEMQKFFLVAAGIVAGVALGLSMGVLAAHYKNSVVHPMRGKQSLSDCAATAGTFDGPR
jgi:hypothetical protein